MQLLWSHIRLWDKLNKILKIYGDDMNSVIFWLPPFLYFIILVAIIGYFLHMVYRLVLAVEKIADNYRKND